MCCNDLQEAEVSKRPACSSIQGLPCCTSFFLGQDKFIPDGWEVLGQHGLTNSVCLRGKRKMTEVNLCWELTLGKKLILF